MGFLDKLWDETLAGPAPDSGLGKIRKNGTFPARRRPRPLIIPDDVPASISRSITIVRTHPHPTGINNLTADSSSEPSSPAGSATPTSPFSPVTPRGDYKKFGRRKSTMQALERPEQTNQTVIDWMIVNSVVDH